MNSQDDQAKECFPVPVNPLLSICIPTYNRSKYLSVLLENLTHNIFGAIGDIEILIADNASTDETPLLAESYRDKLPLRIIRRPENIIGPRNYIQLIHQEAVGIYCLILGDDDMIVAGGLEYLINALKTHPEADFFINNFANADHADIHDAVIKGASHFTGEFQPLGLIKYNREIPLESFLEGVATEHFSYGLYLSFLSLIFRRELVLAEAEGLDQLLIDARVTQFQSEFWFTHYVLWLRTLSRRRGYFLPHVVIIQGIGAQGVNWASEQNLIGIWTQVYPMLYKEFAGQEGVSASQREKFRCEIVTHYWNGVRLSFKKRIWPFEEKGNWVSHSLNHTSMLLAHPIKLLQFLISLIGGFLTRYLKNNSLIRKLCSRFIGDFLPRSHAAPQFMQQLRAKGEIVGGIFRGMRYQGEAVCSAPDPKFLGTYECELNPVLERWKGEEFQLILDVGAAEGYFAVGLARIFPRAQVIAFESTEQGRKLLLSMAQQNGVEKRIVILGHCGLSELKKSFENTGPTLLLMDVEGAERKLLNLDVLPALRLAHIIVELHDCFDPGVGDLVKSRLLASHDIEEIWTRERTWSDFVFPRNLIQKFWLLPYLKQYACESRPGPMRWLCCTPKGGE